MPVKSQSILNNNLPLARLVTSKEVNLTLKSFNTKKAPGTDRIPTKLVKLALSLLSIPLAIASLASSKFPDNAEVATVILIDKKTGDKYDISNFRPVSLLKCFWNVYETIIKCRLVQEHLAFDFSQKIKL